MQTIVKKTSSLDTTTTQHTCMLCAGGFFHASCGGLEHTRIGCKHMSNGACCFFEACLSTSDAAYSVACDGSQMAMPCCKVGITESQCRVSSATNICCLWESCSIPFTEEYLRGPAWGLCGFQCVPRRGFAVPPPTCQVIDRPLQRE